VILIVLDGLFTIFIVYKNIWMDEKTTMNQDQEEQARAAARLCARIRQAEKQSQRLNDELETTLKTLTGEQAELYARMVEAQERHAKSVLSKIG